MRSYNILANIKMQSIFYPTSWEKFQCEEQLYYDLDICIDSNYIYKYGIEILDNAGVIPTLKNNSCILSVNFSWDKAKIHVKEENEKELDEILSALLISFLSRKKALLIHSSLSVFAGRGLMFLGPSGIGKTTQAELWMKFRGAEIINGDMVFVKQESDHFLGCGSPWHGSSPYCLNRQVPLSALIVLKQSQQNLIRRLTGFEMVSTVLNSVFLPSWYQEGYKAACDTVDVLLRTVPVYELSCRPDEDAVRLTEETVFGKNSILL